ncbi:MAG: hypothetical protein ACRDRH_29570 [Pseudonocardia sp.]
MTHAVGIPTDGQLVARKVRAQNTIDSVYGILALPEGTDVLLDELRGPAKLP